MRTARIEGCGFKAKGADDAKAEEVFGGIYKAGFKGIAEKVK